MSNRKFFKWIALSIQCLLGVLLLRWMVVSNRLDAKQLIDHLTQPKLAPFLLGILCFALVMYLSALRYRLFLSAAVPMNYLIGTTLFQNALLTFMPWRIGEVSYPLLLRRDYNVPIASSSASLIAIRLMDLSILVVVAALGGNSLGFDTRSAIVILGSTGILILLLGLLFIWRWSLVPTRVQQFLSSLRPLCQTRQLSIFIVLSIAIFILTTFQTMLILNSVSLQVRVLDVAILNALGMLVALLPIHPPGGWGTIDTFQIVILKRLGYPSQTLLPTILAAHSIYTAIIIVGGVIGWLLRARRPVSPKAGSLASQS